MRKEKSLESDCLSKKCLGVFFFISSFRWNVVSMFFLEKSKQNLETQTKQEEVWTCTFFWVFFVAWLGWHLPRGKEERRSGAAGPLKPVSHRGWWNQRLHAIMSWRGLNGYTPVCPGSLGCLSLCVWPPKHCSSGITALHVMGQGASVPNTTYEKLAATLVKCGADPFIEGDNGSRSSVCFVCAACGNSGVLEAIIQASIESGRCTLQDYIHHTLCKRLHSSMYN